MKQWIEHEMDYEKVKFYLENAIFDCNALSEILKSTNFTKGRFFTFLPPEMNLNEMYNLTSPFTCFAVPKGTPYQILVEEPNAAAFIVAKGKANPLLASLFDDVYVSPSDPCFKKNPDDFVISYKEEVYYFLRNRQISLELAAKYLRYSNHFWHSLCILSEIDLPIDQKKVDTSFFEQACLHAKFMIFVAYDADGYLYWEKTGD